MDLRRQQKNAWSSKKMNSCVYRKNCTHFWVEMKNDGLKTGLMLGSSQY
ncbi:conserved hypothetical protein [delta proteobacterium NaphS2]|nr:conserved hypothetical protein [delta proteobacterium NaphS2]